MENLNKEFDNVGLDPRLTGITALNPFCNYNSSSRSVMLSSHLSQATVLIRGEESIVQSGLEREFAKQTFNKKVENDSRFISFVLRYRAGVDVSSVNHLVDGILIYEDLVTNEISYIDLPYNSDMHKYFGFKYEKNQELLDNLTTNDIIPAGTVLASSPAVGENESYKYGVNMNMCLMSMNETSEDGVVISKAAAEKLPINIFEKRTVEFGTDTFMLNLYGDNDTYKPFPEIGEEIHESGALVALRDHNDELAPALMSIKDTQDFNPMFDKVTYVRPGRGVVKDIKVHHTPKAKKELHSNTDGLVNRYANAYIAYMQDIIDVYDKILSEHINRFGNDNLRVSPKLTRLIVDAKAITDSSNPNSDKYIKKLYRNDPMDIYKIDFVIQYTLDIGKGFKITDKSGNKAIIVDVWENEDMPIDKNGNRADIIQDPASTISRMNIGRLYEQYISQASRQVKMSIVKDLEAISDESDLDREVTIDDLSTDIVNSFFNRLLEFLHIMGNKQYDKYKSVAKLSVKKDILREVIEKEFYIYYTLDNPKQAYLIVEDLKNSKFAVDIGKITYKDREGKPVTSKEDILIGPMYTMLLAKIADTWLATSSAKVNHFGLPTSTSKAEKHRLAWRNSGTKILSETEARLYVAYGSDELLAELKDMGTSIPAHENMTLNILNADMPTNMEHAVDRTKIPFGQDKARETIDSLMNAAGFSIAYKKDNKIHH